MNRKTAKKRSLKRSLQEYLRGIAGGLLFSLPLLYTMEVWWAGFIAHPLRLLIYVLATFTLLGYNRFAGLRSDASRTEMAIDSVEEMGLGLAIATVVLWLLGQIAFDMAVEEIAGKIITEAMTVAIGVSIGTAQLGGGEGDQEDDTGMEEEAPQSGSSPVPSPAKDDSFGGQLPIAFCGAVLFAANVAPTEEIIMIATEIDSGRLVSFALLSLLMGALILFYSDFTGSQQLTQELKIVTVVFGAVVTYAIALVVSAALLWFFGRFDGISPITCLAETVVLGFAATLGSAAGRLLLQQQ